MLYSQIILRNDGQYVYFFSIPNCQMKILNSRLFFVLIYMFNHKYWVSEWSWQWSTLMSRKRQTGIWTFLHLVETVIVDQVISWSGNHIPLDILAFRLLIAIHQHSSITASRPLLWNANYSRGISLHPWSNRKFPTKHFSLQLYVHFSFLHLFNLHDSQIHEV